MSQQTDSFMQDMRHEYKRQHPLAHKGKGPGFKTWLQAQRFGRRI